MDLEIPDLSEGLLAYGAPVGSLSGVNPQVNPQAVLAGELLLADGARDLSFGYVVLLVPLQVRQVDEGLSALGAEVLAIADVVAHVSLQQAGDEESLPATLAHVRTISGVPALVVRQLESRREALAAVLAGERHLARVALHVSLEVRGLREALVTDVAVEGLLAAVGQHVLRQGLQFGEALPALSTSVRAHRAVGLQVVVEERLCSETFVACRANKRLLSGMNALVIHQLGLVREGLIAHATSESVSWRPNLLFPYAWLHVVPCTEPGWRKWWQGWKRERIGGNL